MKNNYVQPIATGYDLFRISKAKLVVDICPNSLRSYAKLGLPLYYRGKAVFVSKSELAHFIRSGAPATLPAEPPQASPCHPRRPRR